MQPLIVRLPNWIGDVVMTLPALRLMTAHGYALQLVGKGWTPSLLAAEAWPVNVYPKPYLERIHLLRRLAADARRADVDFARRDNAMIFSKSFSSALEMRLAGLHACGHGTDGRQWLLHRSVPLPKLHKLLIYWQLATAFLDVQTPAPANIALGVAENARRRAAELKKQYGLERYVVLCPFATGDIRGATKRWPWFVELAKLTRTVLGLPAVLCPGPGAEQTEAHKYLSDAVVLNDVGLADYAALLEGASLVIANDTGPGHIAAAVGAPLISIFGASDPARYRPWGPNVTVLQEAQGWCSLERVLDTARAVLSTQVSPAQI